MLLAHGSGAVMVQLQSLVVCVCVFSNRGGLAVLVHTLNLQLLDLMGIKTSALEIKSAFTCYTAVYFYQNNGRSDLK